jgi:Rod binding domain-containing protein
MDTLVANAPPVRPVATPEQLSRVRKVSKDFEQSFLQVMMTQMFDTVQDSAFSGGEGEAAFKSFLTDAFARQMSSGGGIGLARQLTHEMLKMQGLTDPATLPPGAAAPAATAPAKSQGVIA